MLIKEKSTMTESQKIATRNSNSAYLLLLSAIPMGIPFPYFGTTAPEGWAICQGQSLSKTSYPDLFGVIGYTFGGSGDTFKLPDMREKGFIGYKQGSTVSGTLGDTVGENKHTLSQTELPATLGMHASILGTSIGHGTVATVSGSGTQALIASTEGDEIALTNTGGGQAVSLVSKSVVCNFIMRLV